MLNQVLSGVHDCLAVLLGPDLAFLRRDSADRGACIGVLGATQHGALAVEPRAGLVGRGSLYQVSYRSSTTVL
jgi:hypothetical protein